MWRFDYPATLTRDRKAGGYVVTFRDIPEAITQGDDLADARRQAEDCLEEAIAGRIRLQEPIPEPTTPRRTERLIRLPASMAAKAALYLALNESRLTQAELARRLGIGENDVRRMLDPRHVASLPKLAGALAVLGKRLVLGVEAA